MGYKQSRGMIVIAAALLLLTPLAYGQQVSVNGKICCTSTANCPPGSAGVPGVPVNLNCTTPSGGVEVDQDITNNAGEFGILVNTTIPLEGDGPIFTAPCVASVNLPLNSTNCPILNTATGTLVGITNPVFAPVGNLTVTLFINGSLNLF